MQVLRAVLARQALARSLAPFAFLLGVLTVPVTHATGLDYLAGQQQADGSFVTTASSIATPVQTAAEVLRAWQALGLTPSGSAAARSYLTANTDTNTEYLARTIVANAQAGGDVSAAITELLSRQNTDGGFGSATGEASSVLDTVFTLDAIASSGQGVAATSSAVAQAVGFLLSQQQTDGGFVDGNNVESVYLTALAMRSLWYSRHAYADVPVALARAQTFLLNQRDATGLWGETFNSALALIALVPYLPDLTAVSGSISALRGSELADGSWNEDPYTTALTLRAFALADSPQPNPDYVTIQGRVIDAQTGSPLGGVTVALTGPVSPSLTTGSDGAFLFRSLPAGSYTVQMSLASYGTLSTVTSGQLGQTLDLGTLSLTKSQGATTGTIKGVVTDAATAQPLAGVSVSATGATPVLTDASGSYQLSNVPPGLVTVSASLSGYATASGSANLVAGGVMIFSPALSSGTAQGATLSGTVTSGATGAPLSGVTISVSGAATASAVTDAAGNYQVAGLGSGAVTLTATLGGYDTVTSGAVISQNATVRFSPRLYPTGTTPPNANTSSVTGLMLDAGSNAPLPGASITAVFGTTTQTLTSDAAGRFTVTGLSAPQGTLHVAVTGYVSADLGIALDPLATLDIGQVRLRKTQAPVLLPDLTVTTVDRTAAVTDPRTLLLSGTVAATLSNVGTSNAPASVQVLAFYDANNNGVFDQGDTALGQVATTGELAVGASATVSIPVQGALPFRDAPILVWVDSTQTVAELKETNNIGSTVSACQVKPDIGTFQPVIKWAWTKGNVITAPIVGPLLDTNGDGKIDQNDDPAIIFVTYVGFPDGQPGVLHAISGKDGHDLWSVTDPSLAVGAETAPALADIDGDGKPEIVSYLAAGGMVAFNNDGTLKWKSSNPPSPGFYNYGSPTIADIDGDGKAEILARNYVLNYDGSLRFTFNPTFYSYTGHAVVTVAADFDGDGKPEITTGSTMVHVDGTVYWHNPLVPDGRMAVANFDGGPYPQLVVVAGGQVYMVNHDGTIKWGPVYVPARNGGAPTIADVDGDGIPDIGIAGESAYTVLNADGSVKWRSPTSDGSGATGSTAFDFAGNGQSEIVYFDEQKLRVYSGASGQVLFSIPNYSVTALEYPTVADVDGDGHADIVVPSQSNGTNPGGIRVFQGVNNSWVATRKIWNEYNYHITNVNDDGSLPKVEKNSWQASNTYRLNAFPDRSATGQPDLTASLLTLLDNGTGALPSLTLRVGNAGAAPSPDGVQVTFYQGDPAAGGVSIGSATLASLAAGAYRDLRLDNVTLPGSADLYAVVDPANAVTECNKANNTDHIPAVATNLLGTVSVATDAPAYGPNAPVAITSTVTNTGAFTASYQLDLRIEDPSGTLVAQLPAQGAGPLASSTATPVVAAWNTGATLAGSYQVHARLLSPSGALLGEALTPLTIGLAGGAPNSAAVTLRVLTDRPVYNTTDTVRIESLVANASANVLVNAVSLRITILDPNNQVTFTQTGPVGQLPPGALRDLLLPVSLNGAALAIYKVTGDILDASQTVLAHAETSYTVRFDLGKSLSGTVAVQSQTLEIGTPQSCTDTLSDLGTIAVTGLNVHHALVNIDTQQLVGDTREAVDLLPGASSTSTRTLATDSLAAGNYACLLQADIDGRTQTLAFAPFKLTEPPIRIDAGLKMGTKGRLLVLLDNPRACDDDGRGMAMGDSNSCHGSDNDPYGPSAAPALSAQRAFLEKLLKAEGWSYTITETSDDFARAFHTGGYTVYAVFAEREKLDETTQEELREAVFRGEGLLVGGAHDNRNGKLDDALGLRLIGRVASAVRVNLPQDPLGLPGSFDLLPRDPAVRIKRTTAQSLGTYILGSPAQASAGTGSDCRELGDGTQAGMGGASPGGDAGHDDCDGHPEHYLDAATLNSYGHGQAAFTGFDLLATATQAGDGSLPAALLKKLLVRVHPATINLLPGAGVPIDLSLANRGVATTATVTLTLPTGVTVLDPGTGSAVAATASQPGTVTWSVSLALQDTQTLHLWLRLPDAPGSLTLAAKVEVTRNGATKTYAQPSMTLTVDTPPTLDQLLAQARSLHGSYPQEGDRLVAAERHLESALATAKLRKAIDDALAATDDLLGSTNSAINDLRSMIDVWLRGAAQRAY